MTVEIGSKKPGRGLGESTCRLKSDPIHESLRSMNPEYKRTGPAAASGLRRAEDAVPTVSNHAFAAEFHPDIMQSVNHLARLKPDRATQLLHPAAPMLIRRFGNVSAASKQRLVDAGKLRHCR